eukprot:UN10926
MESYLELFQPLWVATNILKAYVSRYTTNVQEKISPLNSLPHLASFKRLPSRNFQFELLNLTKSTAGFNNDENAPKSCIRNSCTSLGFG